MTIPPADRTDPGTRIRVLSIRRTPGGLSGRKALRVDWSVESTSAERQLGYELQSAPTDAFDDGVVGSGVVGADDQVDVVVPGGLLRSREVRHVRVRVATRTGWSAWSGTATVEAGLLAPDDWRASAVTLPDDPGAREQSPSPLLRKVFSLSAPPVRARLHVTSLGVHEVRVNGVAVGDHVLDPGWTSYHRRLLVSTHDVTGLLVEGANVLAGLLGDGWHRGRLGFPAADNRGRYGDQVALLAQLEVELADGSTTTVVTDETWRTSTGEIRSADLYDGCTVDLRRRQAGWDRPGFDDRTWTPAAVVPVDLAVLQPQVAPPIRTIQTFQPLRSRGRDDSLLLDAGQNVAGFVRLVVRGRAGDVVVVRHAEVLEADGALHTLSLRSAKATDNYVLDGDETVVLQPTFTFHGFRYATVTTTADVLDAEVVAISSDTPPRATFTCSDPTLTRFHENVRWSQRDNFVGIPTDCPQRDERLGWTGDAQAFAPTACTLFDARAFWESWLIDVALDQTADGAVPSVVPNILGEDEFAVGRAGWADAATVVPWAVHVAYDDTEVLAEQLPSMTALVGYLQRRRHEDGLLGGEFQFGDWLDPDAPGDRPQEAKTSSDFLANAFFSYSARILSRSCQVLGASGDAQRYADLADEIAGLAWARWRAHALGTQTGCAVALEMAIAPAEEHEEIGRALAGLVRAGDGRIATGFLGTPLVLPALTRTGHLAEAYLMLLRRQMPSWLYQVDHGATTVWERWDAIRPDGSIHDGVMHLSDAEAGHMLSFNHYAYGAVIDWVYHNLAGIAPDAETPGYRHVVLAPRPVAGIDHAAATVETAYGPITAEWTMDDAGMLTARYSLPFGVTATFRPPGGEGATFSVDGRQVTGSVSIGPGQHDVHVPSARIVSPALPSLR